MISIFYEKDKRKSQVCLDGFLKREAFKHLTDMGFKYNKKNKLLEGNPFVTRMLIEDSIDEIEISIEDKKNIIEDSNPLSGIKKTRKSIDNNLLVKPPLAEYQTEGIQSIIRNSGFVLEAVVGSGKTYITISALNHLYPEVVDKVVIVCVPSIVYNWKVELLKFSNLFKDEDIYIVNSKNRSPFTDDIKVVILTYDGVSMISRDAFKEVDKELPTSKSRVTKNPLSVKIDKWSNRNMWIFDEVHHCKTTSSYRYKFLYPLVRQDDRKVGLSGTLKANSYADVYSPYSLIDPSKSLLKGFCYSDFIKYVANQGTKYSRTAITSYKQDKVEEFNKIFDLVTMKVTYEQLPIEHKVITKKIYVPIGGLHLEIYKAILLEDLKAVKEEKGFLCTKTVIGRFPYLMLCLSDPLMLQGRIHGESLNMLINKWDLELNEKYRVCKNILKEHIDEDQKKVIIWNNNPKVINALSDKFKEYSPIVLHGQIEDSTPENKEKMVKEFREGDCKLLIANPKVLGTGQNLHEASINIFFNLSFNFAEIRQTLGRIDRIGQKNNIINYFLLFDKTLDDICFETFLRKGTLNDLKVKYDTLGIEDYQQLFSGNVDILDKLLDIDTGVENE